MNRTNVSKVSIVSQASSQRFKGGTPSTLGCLRLAGKPVPICSMGFQPLKHGQDGLCGQSDYPNAEYGCDGQRWRAIHERLCHNLDLCIQPGELRVAGEARVEDQGGVDGAGYGAPEAHERQDLIVGFATADVGLGVEDEL